MLQIETARLRLVACTVEAVQAALSDRDGLAALLSARVPEDWPQADLRDFLPLYARIADARAAAAGWGIWLILLERERELVGDVGFKGAPGDGIVEIGYSVLPPRRGHGYAGEAARALTEWALARPGVRRVTAECLEDNLASIRVLEKIGMRPIGRTDEGLLWAIERPDAEPVRSSQ